MSSTAMSEPAMNTESTPTPVSPGSPPPRTPRRVDKTHHIGSVRKRRTYNPQTPHVCLACRRRYKTLAELHAHHLVHPQRFICRFPPCAAGFVSIDDRISHEVSVHDKPTPTVFSCFMCSFTRTEEHNYKRAITDHLWNCHEGVDKKVAMNRILNSRTVEGVSNACGFCGFSTTAPAEMQSHVSKDHGDLVAVSDTTLKDRLVCFMCDFETPRRENMRLHIKFIHEHVHRKETLARIINNSKAGKMEPKVPDPFAHFLHVCHICSFSTAKRCNMYRHVLYTHKDLDIKQVMAEITSGVED